MKLEISQQSFNIVKYLLSNTYLELMHQRDKEAELPFKKRFVSDTAELVREALKEIGVKVSPTRIDLDKEGNFK